MTVHDLLTPDDVASRLGVAVPTVLKWIRRGRIRAYRWSRKTIRLDWADVLTAIREAQSCEGAADGSGRTTR